MVVSRGWHAYNAPKSRGGLSAERMLVPGKPSPASVMVVSWPGSIDDIAGMKCQRSRLSAFHARCKRKLKNVETLREVTANRLREKQAKMSVSPVKLMFEITSVSQPVFAMVSVIVVSPAQKEKLPACRAVLRKRDRPSPWTP